MRRECSVDVEKRSETSRRYLQEPLKSSGLDSKLILGSDYRIYIRTNNNGGREENSWRLMTL
jgi:hypothetical protein